MQKAYSRRYWKNSPNTSTPLNETNLNAMDAGLDIVDTRVVELYGYQERAEQAAEDAEAASESATTSKNSAAASATLAQSYARGGTGTRTGEDNDNAKHYSEVAKAEADRASQAAGFDPADYVHVSGDNLSSVSGTLADVTAIINGTWADN